MTEDNIVALCVLAFLILIGPAASLLSPSDYDEGDR